MRKLIYGSLLGFVFTSLLFIAIFHDSLKYTIIYQFVTHQYDGEFDEQEMEDSIISGIVSGLGDQHSMYFSSENFSDFMQDMSTSYEGIGVQVQINESEPYVVINEVIDGGAASEENIYSGDIIKSVNGEEITADNAENVADMIKAQEDVNLELYRPSTEEEIVIDTKSKSYQNPSVHTSYYTQGDQTNAVIKIDSFIDSTDEEFETALNDVENTEFDKLVIDLRDNPGGELGVLVNIANLIVNNDRPYLTTKIDGEVVETYQSSLEESKDYPIVVLQNENTASAAEILSSALKEINGAQVIGSTSYGKGSVQRVFEMPLSDSAMKVTIAHWYTADYEQIDGKGIEPTISIDDESFDVTQIPLNSNLKVGDSSYNVFLVKKYLTLLGYDEDLSTTKYDQTTKENISDFQQKNELDVTGIVDIYTADELYNHAKEVQNSPENDNVIMETFKEE